MILAENETGGFFLGSGSYVLWIWCFGRSRYRGKGNQSLPGKIQTTDSLSDFGNDAWILLCDCAGTDDFRRIKTGNELRQFPDYDQPDRFITRIRNADCKREK